MSVDGVVRELQCVRCARSRRFARARRIQLRQFSSVDVMWTRLEISGGGSGSAGLLSADDDGARPARGAWPTMTAVTRFHCCSRPRRTNCSRPSQSSPTYLLTSLRRQKRSSAPRSWAGDDWLMTVVVRFHYCRQTMTGHGAWCTT